MFCFAGEREGDTKLPENALRLRLLLVYFPSRPRCLDGHQRIIVSGATRRKVKIFYQMHTQLVGQQQTRHCCEAQTLDGELPTIIISIIAGHYQLAAKYHAETERNVRSYSSGHWMSRHSGLARLASDAGPAWSSHYSHRRLVKQTTQALWTSDFIGKKRPHQSRLDFG